MIFIRNSNVDNLEADIVVIGGGGSGLPAAVSAAEAGVKNIIVLEKRRALGGNAMMAGCMFAVESPAQKRIGVNYTRDQVFKEKMDFANWTVDPRVVRTFVNTTAEVIQWLENKGLKFDHVSDMGFRGQYPKVVHMFSPGPEGRIGKTIMETLTKDCRKLGVHLLREKAARHILTDKKGKVTGVLAVKKDKEIKIATKAAIIAAGGFAGNKEMMDKYLPAEGFRLSLSLPHTGDGLGMAGEVGAVIDDVFAMLLVGPHHYQYAASLNHLLRRPEMMLVNKRGERFSDESLGLGRQHSLSNALNRQPDLICYALLDSEILRSMIKKRELYGGVAAKMGTSWFDQLYDDLKADTNKGVAKIANTWDEIAQYIQARPEVLKETVEQYNSYCDKGYDASTKYMCVLLGKRGSKPVRFFSEVQNVEEVVVNHPVKRHEKKGV